MVFNYFLRVFPNFWELFPNFVIYNIIIFILLFLNTKIIIFKNLAYCYFCAFLNTRYVYFWCLFTYQRYSQPTIAGIQYGKGNGVGLQSFEEYFRETCFLIVGTYCGHALNCLGKMWNDWRICWIFNAL